MPWRGVCNLSNRLGVRNLLKQPLRLIEFPAPPRPRFPPDSRRCRRGLLRQPAFGALSLWCFALHSHRRSPPSPHMGDRRQSVSELPGMTQTLFSRRAAAGSVKQLANTSTSDSPWALEPFGTSSSFWIVNSTTIKSLSRNA